MVVVVLCCEYVCVCGVIGFCVCFVCGFDVGEI